MKILNHSFCLVSVLFFSLLSINNFGQTNSLSGEVKEFTQYLDKEVPSLMRVYNVPGASFALIKYGEIVWVKSFGYRDKAKELKTDINTVYQAASNTKTITAIAIMRLCEEGKIDLDDPVEKYLTRWHLAQTGFDNDKVTIRRILSHTAGLSREGYPSVLPSKEIPPVEEILTGKNKDEPDVRVIIEPGTRFMYSGGGFTLLQLVIEEITGEKYTDFIKKEILIPLGINQNTDFNLTPKIEHLVATGYDSEGKPYEYYYFIESDACGSLSTNIMDFSKIVQTYITNNEILNDSNRIVKAKTLESMYTPIAKIQGIIGADSVGLSFFMETLDNGVKIISHGGSNRGFKSNFWIDPRSGDGLVVLTNSRNGEAFYTNVLSDWTKWEFGAIPAHIKTLNRVSLIIASLGAFLNLIFIIFIFVFIRQCTRKRRKFVYTTKVKSASNQIIRTFLYIILPTSAIGFWMTQMHADLNSFDPIRGYWVSIGFVLCCTILILNGLFYRVKKTK